jgi:DNA-binding transcriptional LysR family regulator
MILNECIHRLLILSEELHFRRAAERLHLSQPALSGSLKSLESELGARLFRRTSRSVELTEAGNILVSEARRLLKECERSVALVRECESDIIGPVHVGYCSAINLKWLSALISSVRKDGILEADCRFIGREACCLKEQLDKRTLHAAFFTGNLRRCEESTFQYVKLFRENFQVVVAVGHRLARACAITIRDLQDEPVVWLSRDVNPLLHSTFADVCCAQSYRPRVVQEARTLYECLHFAREGIGITFLPSFMSTSGGGGLVFVALSSGFPVDYTLVYRRGIADLHPMDRFVSFVRDYVAAQKWTDT